MYVIVDDPSYHQAAFLPRLKMVLVHHWPIILGGSSIFGLVIGIWYGTRRRIFRKVKIYSGLRNIGNSCYLNSVIQALVPVMDKMQIQPTTPFSAELVSLLSGLTSMKRTLDASKLVRTMGGSLNCEQQDAHELLQAILQVLSKSQKTMVTFTMDASTPQTVYQSVAWESSMIGCVKCTACGQTSDSGTRVHNVSIITISSASPLEEALHESMRPDRLSDYQCSCGSIGTCYKSSSIVKWPNILILHLQRLGVAGTSMVKYDGWTQFPITMGGWRREERVLGIGMEIPEYMLAAVIEHNGGAGGGHYIAYRKIQESGRTRWLYCSDSIVKKVSIDQVLACQAYILIYEKVS